MPKAGSNYTCLAVFVIDSALKKDEYYYLQVFLNEFKYIEKEVIRYISCFRAKNTSHLCVKR